MASTENRNHAKKQKMPDTLYDGSYGDAFEQDVIDLIEPSTEEDESIRSMFAEGEKLARGPPDCQRTTRWTSSKRRERPSSRCGSIRS